MYQFRCYFSSCSESAEICPVDPFCVKISLLSLSPDNVGFGSVKNEHCVFPKLKGGNFIHVFEDLSTCL